MGYPPVTLSLLSATEVIAGLLFAQLTARSPDHRPWLIIAILLAISGLLCLATKSGTRLAGRRAGRMWRTRIVPAEPDRMDRSLA